MGEGTTPGCLEKSVPAAAEAIAAETAVAATGRLAGMPAAIETLRATRTRRPARSISISVRLVSSSSSASSRISALSSLEMLAVVFSSGWRAMIVFPKTLLGLWRKRQAQALGSSFGAYFGGKASDGEA